MLQPDRLDAMAEPRGRGLIGQPTDKCNCYGSCFSAKTGPRTPCVLKAARGEAINRAGPSRMSRWRGCHHIVFARRTIRQKDADALSGRPRVVHPPWPRSDGSMCGYVRPRYQGGAQDRCYIQDVYLRRGMEEDNVQGE